MNVAMTRVDTQGAIKERLVGSNVDVRTVLHFKLPVETVKTLLPVDWEADPPTSGHAVGANLRLTLIDPVAAFDAQGVPRPTVCFMHCGIPARSLSTPARGLMLFTGLSPRGAGPYGTNLTAIARVERRTLCDSNRSLVDESWAFAAAGAESVSVRLAFERAEAARETGSIHVYSRVTPRFCRIYRYDQLVDIAHGGSAEHQRLQRFELEASGEPFGHLFDGQEQLVSIVSVPSYSRQVLVPEP